MASQNKIAENHLLSVIIPVYNEEDTLEDIVTAIQAVPLKKEIIIVDDGSTDGTKDVYEKLKDQENIQIIFHEKNRGKGIAIRTAIKHIRGDLVIIQDADLEYDPRDYLELVQPIINGETQVVYGSRFLNPENKHSYWSFYIGGRSVTWITNLLYMQRLTDVPTCYKVFDAEVLKSVSLKCNRFEFCPEVTAKIVKRGIKIKELPIHYYPRKFEEGKKLKWYDGVEAIWTLLKYRFIK